MAPHVSRGGQPAYRTGASGVFVMVRFLLRPRCRCCVAAAPGGQRPRNVLLSGGPGLQHPGAVPGAKKSVHV